MTHPGAGSSSQGLLHRVAELVPLDWSILRHAGAEPVPFHLKKWWFCLGGTPMYLFIVQVITGILLMLYYRPSAETAFESVEFIMTAVPFGWLIRSVHSWSANLMVFFAFVHLATVYFTKAYRKPREITWIFGLMSFAIIVI